MRRGILLTARSGPFTPASYGTSGAQGVATTVANVVVTKPAGTVAGQLLCVVCWANNGTATWSAPAGWTPGAANTTTLGTAIFYRLVDGTEGSTFTFTRATNLANAAGAVITRITGADPLSPVDVSAVGGVGSGLAIALPTVTPTGPIRLLVQLMSKVGTAADTFTAPGTATLRSTAGATASGSAYPFAVGDEVVGAGATGSRTWGYGSSGASRGAIIAVKPAA